jgi:hypothetical protein
VRALPGRAWARAGSPEKCIDNVPVLFYIGSRIEAPPALPGCDWVQKITVEQAAGRVRQPADSQQMQVKRNAGG